MLEVVADRFVHSWNQSVTRRDNIVKQFQVSRLARTNIKDHLTYAASNRNWVTLIWP